MIIEKTVTTIFMVPTLDIGRDSLLKNNFVNAYSEDTDCNIDYINVVFLLFKPNDLQQFKEFLENEYLNNKEIVEDYDYDEGYVVVIYRLDNRYIKDFDLIREGKYSKTSKEFQALFPETVKNVTTGLDEPSIQHLIFNKDPKLIQFWEDVTGTPGLSSRGMEVWTRFIPHNETLYIKEHYDNKRDIG